jgi:hypothetical protein
MAVEELVSTGWWSIERQGYRINHHMEHQPEPDLFAKRRRLTAERVKKHRRTKAGLSDPSTPSASLDASRPDPSRPVPRNASRNGVTADPRFWKTPEEMAR